MSSTSARSALFRFFRLAALGRVLLAQRERALSLEQVGALQRLLIVCDRLGQLALLSDRIAPVVAGVGIVRGALQRLLIVWNRLGHLALPSELNTHVAMGRS